VQRAKAVTDQLNSLPAVAGLSLTGDYALAAIPARCALELKDWKAADTLQVRQDGVPWAQAITWMAVGVGSARAGNLDRARQAEQHLASLRDAIAKQNNTYWSNQVEVQRLEVAAWIAQAGTPTSSTHTDGIAIMRSAAELEESMDKHAVTPGPVIPAREMLAEMLSLAQKSHRSLSGIRSCTKNCAQPLQRALWRRDSGRSFRKYLRRKPLLPASDSNCAWG
jgi:hypothetical protein